MKARKASPETASCRRGVEPTANGTQTESPTPTGKKERKERVIRTDKGFDFSILRSIDPGEERRYLVKLTKVFFLFLSYFYCFACCYDLSLDCSSLSLALNQYSLPYALANDLNLTKLYTDSLSCLSTRRTRLLVPLNLLSAYTLPSMKAARFSSPASIKAAILK